MSRSKPNPAPAPAPADEEAVSPTPIADEAETETDEVLPPLPEPLYAAEFYAGLGIAVCPVCGDKKRVDADGQPVCSGEREDCAWQS